MDLEVTDLDGDVRKIVLSGRLDTQGADEVEARFTASIVPAQKSTIVDLQDVDFIASMGIRMFIAVARSLATEQVPIALFGAQELVAEVFDNVSLNDLMPVCTSESEALAAVAA